MLETDPSFCYLPHSAAMASAAVFSDHLGDGVVNSPLRVRPGEKRAHEKAFLSSNPLLQCLSFLQSGLTSFLSLPPNTLTYHIPHTPAYIYTVTHSHTHAHIRTQPPSLSQFHASFSDLFTSFSLLWHHQCWGSSRKPSICCLVCTEFVKSFRGYLISLCLRTQYIHISEFSFI